VAAETYSATRVRRSLIKDNVVDVRSCHAYSIKEKTAPVRWPNEPDLVASSFEPPNLAVERQRTWATAESIHTVRELNQGTISCRCHLIVDGLSPSRVHPEVVYRVENPPKFDSVSVGGRCAGGTGRRRECCAHSDSEFDV
jgi:hypothetical protein